jgi:hypothetical protein
MLRNFLTVVTSTIEPDFKSVKFKKTQQKTLFQSTMYLHKETPKYPGVKAKEPH